MMPAYPLSIKTKNQCSTLKQALYKIDRRVIGEKLVTNYNEAVSSFCFHLIITTTLLSERTLRFVELFFKDKHIILQEIARNQLHYVSIYFSTVLLLTTILFS